MNCTHLRREHLIIGAKWFLGNVVQERVRMSWWWCDSSGCFLGWMGHCPELRQCGFYHDGFNFVFPNGESVYDKGSEEFFGLSDRQWYYLFGVSRSGKKSQILQRVAAVLNQPSPYDEPALANLDQELKNLENSFRKSVSIAMKGVSYETI